MDQESSSEVTDNEKPGSSCSSMERIENPDTCIVKNQVVSDTVTIVVVRGDGVQQLYTFKGIDDDTTLQDLIENISALTRCKMKVHLLKDPKSKYHYVVILQRGIEKDCEDFKVNDRDHHDIEVSPSTHNSPGHFSLVSSNEDKNERESYGRETKPEQQSRALRKRKQLAAGGAGSSKEFGCVVDTDASPGEGHQEETESVEMEVGTNSTSSILNNDWIGSEMKTAVKRKPVITNNENVTSCGEIDNELEKDENMNVDVCPPYTHLYCRAIGIGTYAYVPAESVILSRKGVHMRAPHLRDNSNMVLVQLKFNDIVKIIFNIQESSCTLFFYAKREATNEICELLGMQLDGGPYYNSISPNRKQTRLTLVLDNLSAESEQVLKTLFSPTDLLLPIDDEAVDSYLRFIFPKDIWLDIKNSRPNLHKAKSTVDDNVNKGKTRRIKTRSLTEKLKESKVRNKKVSKEPAKIVKMPEVWINESEENEESEDEVLFENRGTLTQLSKKSVKESPKKLLKRSREPLVRTEDAAYKRDEILLVYPPGPIRGRITVSIQDYDCLRGDRFLNDVIIDFYLKYLMLEVLSEEDEDRTHVFSVHFYQRLISCDASQIGGDRSLAAAQERHDNVRKWTKNVNIFEKDFIIVPIHEHAHWYLAIICFPGLVGKDQASETSAKPHEIPRTTYNLRRQKERKLETVSKSNEKEITKLPCILIFNSLSCAGDEKTVTTALRNYLRCEYVAKFGTEIDFTEVTIKGDCPQVPQQFNYSDCGLYVLQYVESFFKNPIKDYTVPIKTLRHWFEDRVIIGKRKYLLRLITKLRKSQS